MHQHQLPDQPRPEPRWVSCREMAARLKTTTLTLRRLVHDGVVPAIRVGRDFRFDPEEVEVALAVRSNT